jgi:cobalamin-dependent methionine synthase I
MAATIGIEADKLMQKYEITNMAKASIAQSCGAACIEAYCNILQEKILDEVVTNTGEKLYLRPRFSAGYGDVELTLQKEIFAALECTKRIGLTLTDSLLMYPTKSVTAFIGLTGNPESCHIGRCEHCGKLDCEFRS